MVSWFFPLSVRRVLSSHRGAICKPASRRQNRYPKTILICTEASALLCLPCLLVLAVVSAFTLPNSPGRVCPRFSPVGMRLLHTTELRFKEFFESELPTYAILSHRWSNNEVSYQDFLTGKNKDGTGYAKILACCKYAAADTSTHRDGRLFRGRFEWIWIDTCCIDQTSSAELSEAVNSMYRWYANSVVCYAYLSDVPQNNDKSQVMKSFGNSQWFGRGWTLQELLAPTRVVFLNQDWKSIGTRDSLASQISMASGISIARVTGFYDLAPVSVSAAEKFSWISTRKTSRPEDQAYCLLRLFDINMPLLYGEGSKAFRRLQLEILGSSNDESIFIWDIPIGWPWGEAGVDHFGLLATATTDFAPILYHRYKDDHIPKSRRVPGLSRSPYTVTNQGLEIRVPKKLAMQSEFVLPLNYRCFEGDRNRGVYAIKLQKVQSKQSEEFEGWRRNISVPTRQPPISSRLEYKFENRCSTSVGLHIVPEIELWSREQLAGMDTEIIYIQI